MFHGWIFNKNLTKSLFYRVEDSLETLADFKLFENAAQMALDCFLADKKDFSDFFICTASC